MNSGDLSLDTRSDFVQNSRKGRNMKYLVCSDIHGDEKAFSSAVKNEEDASLIRRNVRDKSVYASDVITLDLDENDLYYVSLSDEAAIRYVKHINDLDELYYIRVETDRGLSDVEIFLDGTPLFHFIYSEFVETSAEEEILKYLTLRYKGSDYTLLRFDGTMGVSIYADSALASSYRSYVLLPFGLHRIRLQSPGFEPYETDYVASLIQMRYIIRDRLSIAVT